MIPPDRCPQLVSDTERDRRESGDSEVSANRAPVKEYASHA
jgi:hypothetical protein